MVATLTPTTIRIPVHKIIINKGQIMTYIPNFNDPRVLQRTKHAYGFSLAVLSDTEARGWAKVVFDKYFGPQSNQLSKYLRSMLLTCADTHYSKDTGKTKTYTLNRVGTDYLRDILQRNPVTAVASIEEYTPPIRTKQQEKANYIFDSVVVNEWCRREFDKELTELTFEYKDKSDRLWHPLQNVKREHKKQLLNEAGLKYHYDIESCAPTLILQLAQHNGMDLWLHALQNYLSDKTAYRNHISSIAEIDTKTSKVLINALFCGARLGTNDQFALSHLLNHDAARIQVLKQDEFIRDIKADIKSCWNAITPTMSRRSVISKKTGKIRLKAISSREKWAVYFRLERSVLDVVHQYLISTGNRHFLEHDGWSTEREIDQAELLNFIREHTGFNIKLSVDCETDTEILENKKKQLIPIIYPSVLQVVTTVTPATTPLQSTNAERQKRYRERQKLNKLTAKGN